ncbi:MFS transporter [Aquabacterium sp. A7-Y]|uniref:MFS transporter n=1 Tax=Aquabacterium sp. A7-Y TaxID=1349605 RepID=UPI00223D2DA7|nr:MFS transporter [Aquabacterium sp. A7-Y]MCW7539833.1 MFS transporter [Aquabacterium sp. A7-Y]
MTAAAPPPRVLAATRWALLFGNFVIGCGVMVVSGTLNDLARSLQISVALAGQLIAIAAALMCFGAPLMAMLLGGWDRRRLLTLALLWYALGHALCALMPDYGALWPVRALTVLAAAVFTPQAAAVIGHMAPPEQRGRSITFVFLGWSVASVAGMPISAWIGESLGWRWAMAWVAVIALAAAAAVFRALPDDVRPPGMSLRAWRGVFANPVLMAIVAVTALTGAGQFTVFAYYAPYLSQVIEASPGEISLLFGWFGAWGLFGNMMLSRHVDRIGAARAVAVLLGLVAFSLLLWPLGSTPLRIGVLIVPWALACFASNSAQQARLGAAAPLLAPALMALNTSAIYLGQAVGASGGGWLMEHFGWDVLSWVGLGWTLLALALSLWAARRPALAGGA